MVRLIIFLSIISLTRVGYTQQLVVPANDFPEQHLIGEAFFFGQKYSGQIFFNEDYWRGDILMTSGDVIRNQLIKYCGVTDELIHFNELSNSAVSLDTDLINSFSMINPENGAKLRFIKFSREKGLFGKTEEVFVQVLLENNIKLYAIRNYVNDGSVTAYKNNISYYNELYRSKPEYILINGDINNTLNEKIRKYIVLRLFPEKKKAIKLLLKRNKLRRIRSESGLVSYAIILDENFREIFEQ